MLFRLLSSPTVAGVPGFHVVLFLPWSYRHFSKTTGPAFGHDNLECVVTEACLHLVGSDFAREPQPVGKAIPAADGARATFHIPFLAAENEKVLRGGDVKVLRPEPRQLHCYDDLVLFFGKLDDGRLAQDLGKERGPEFPEEFREETIHIPPHASDLLFLPYGQIRHGDLLSETRPDAAENTPSAALLRFTRHGNVHQVRFIPRKLAPCI
jgi:hypothetical protein